MIHIPPRLFPLGRVLVSPAARAVLDASNESPWTYLLRHGSSLWLADALQAEEPGEHDGEVATYHITANGTSIAVSTNQAHSQTLLTLAEEAP